MARKMVFGTYDTDVNGLWTLAEWALTDAQYQGEFIEVPGRDGSLDVSALLTDGEPRFGSRTLTATFESSEGSRLERKERMDTMVNWLTGWRMEITLPDDDMHYIIGRVQVDRLYNDMAHCAVQVTAICDPWRYSRVETVVRLTAEAKAKTALLSNDGRLTVLPMLEVSGADASVSLQYGAYSWVLSAGIYQLPDMQLPQGGAELVYSGTGDIKLTYRKAVL